MKKYLYLSLIPESLIASQLTPEEFGNYYAVGTEKRSRGQAIFFDIDPEKVGDAIDLSAMGTRCVEHEDGRPRRSSYLSIYRVLERLPLDAIGDLHLATSDGRVLTLQSREWEPESLNSLHLYQEYCPVTPRVASALSPENFLKRITDPAQPVHVPKIIFSELKLDDLAFNPETGNAGNLPYFNIDHLRDCLTSVRDQPGKETKAVVRHTLYDVIFRTLKNGFFVGDQEKMLYYPMPSKEELETKHYVWWRSAQAG